MQLLNASVYNVNEYEARCVVQTFVSVNIYFGIASENGFYSIKYSLSRNTSHYFNFLPFSAVC